MWYFTWFIGITAAILLATMHTLWYEVQVDEEIIREVEEERAHLREGQGTSPPP